MKLTHDKVRALRDATAARSSCVTCEALLIPDRAAAPHCEDCTVSDDAEAEWEQRWFADCDHADIIRALCDEWLERRTFRWSGCELRGATLFNEITERWQVAGRIASYGQPAISGRDWLEKRDSGEGSGWIATFGPDAAYPHIKACASEKEAREFLEGLAKEKGFVIEAKARDAGYEIEGGST